MERRFRNAEHIKLMKKVHEIFRKMRLSGNFHEHLQLVPVFRKDAADDNLLAQRRKSILHRGAELIKNAVGKTRKTADRGIDKTVARENIRQHTFCGICLLIRHEEKGGAPFFTGDIVAYFFTAVPRFACSRRAENKMESHEHPSCHFSNIFLFLIIKGKDEKGKHSRKIFYKRKREILFSQNIDTKKTI